MNLVIDAGNTSIKIAVFNQDEILDFKLVDELKEYPIKNVIDHFKIQALIFSVTRKMDISNLKSDVTNNIPVIELTHNLPVPVTIAYNTPETLGKDRLAAAVAAQKIFAGNPVLVVDMGTAITIDFVSDQGVFEGGIISPGLEMRFKALHHFTGKLPLLAPTNDWNLMGNSTQTAIQYGVLNGIEFEINTYIERYMREYRNIKIIMTGGDAPLFINRVQGFVYLDKFLVLKGLNEILRFNIG